MIAVGGRLGNLLSRGQNYAGVAMVSSSPAASVATSLANLHDGDSSTVFQFANNSANPYITLDGNHLREGGFESASALDGYLSEGGLAGDRWWTTTSGTGTATRTTTAGEFETGVAALKLVGGTGYAIASEVFRVRAGEARAVRLRYKTGTASTVKLRIKNSMTGLYLTSGGTWQTGSTNFFTSSATDSAWHTEEFAYTVESFALVGSDECLLSFTIENSVNGTCYIDNVADYASVNFVSVSGHNIQGTWGSGHEQTPMSVSWSDDGSSWTVVGYATRKAGQFYYSFAALSHRYWKIAFDGTAYSTMWFGEMVIAQAETLAGVLYEGNKTFAVVPGVRSQSPTGRALAISTGAEPTVGSEMRFRVSTRAALDALVALWSRSGQGTYQVVIVPDTSLSDVYHGRLLETVEWTRVAPSTYEVGLKIFGDPLPAVGV